MSEPNYLCRHNTIPDPVFLESEFIYHRFNGNKTYPENEYFSEMKSERFIDGISVNRSKYSGDPKDVLWSIRQENSRCLYEFKDGAVIFCTAEDLSTRSNYNTVLTCEHSPLICNYSHCDIRFTPVPDSKKIIKDLKFFLASLFQTFTD